MLAGASESALWKAELLAATGAELHVFADDEAELFEGLAQGEAGAHVHVHGRAWQADDLTDAAIAVADLDDSDAVGAFVAAARQAGVPVNIVDKPEHCDFAFGALVNRSPLIVAVSTDGAAPVFGQAIRTKIEALLPAGLKNWAQAAADGAPRSRRANCPSHCGAASGSSSPAGRWPSRSARRTSRMRRSFSRSSPAPSSAHDGKGRVTLVGAGPGDPELLTLKAIRALQSADIILDDDLVSPGVLELARREARRMLVGKTGYGPSVKQDDINALIVSLAGQESMSCA
ncbi:Siroheme synthase (Fragment) OS=Bosea thiooxidans OX=53254 GN=ARD30_01780 PE=3 SV=1 [Bosea thiooxidans]